MLPGLIDWPLDVEMAKQADWLMCEKAMCGFSCCSNSHYDHFNWRHFPISFSPHRTALNGLTGMKSELFWICSGFSITFFFNLFANSPVQWQANQLQGILFWYRIVLMGIGKKIRWLNPKRPIQLVHQSHIEPLSSIVAVASTQRHAIAQQLTTGGVDWLRTQSLISLPSPIS